MEAVDGSGNKSMSDLIVVETDPRPDFSFVIGTGRWPSYYGFEGTNTWVLYAIGSAGNRSAPSNSVTRELSGDDCR